MVGRVRGGDLGGPSVARPNRTSARGSSASLPCNPPLMRASMFLCRVSEDRTGIQALLIQRGRHHDPRLRRAELESSNLVAPRDSVGDVGRFIFNLRLVMWVWIVANETSRIFAVSE
jgi:hypothetical protein